MPQIHVTLLGRFPMTVNAVPVAEGNYRAEVTLRPEGDGTYIRWTARWDRTLPGRIVHRKLRTMYPGVVGRLIAAAERSVRQAQP